MKLILWPLSLAELIVVVLWETLLANLRLAGLLRRPSSALHPGIISHQLGVSSHGQMTIVANLVTLTPGTLTLELDKDRGVLTIHTIDARDPEQISREIREKIEPRVAKVFL
jgi:multicomponent Na+:H+ antiporter subunit E